MRKRISILCLCLLISVFGLFGCAEQEEDVRYDPSEIDTTIESIILIADEWDEEELDIWESYPEYIQDYQLMASGLYAEADAFTEAVESWRAGVDECGTYLGHGDFTYEASPSGLDVTMTAYYEERDAEVKFIFDKNLYLNTITVSAQFEMGEIMSKAGMNTLMGMGVVFFVLILMSFIIYLFKYIPVIQEKLTGRKSTETDQEVKAAPAAATTAAISAAQAVNAVPAQEDDTELVAVIAAAIAADEGTDTDGFVVRSIRRRPSNKWNS